jgi:hypothetical protein
MDNKYSAAEEMYSSLVTLFIVGEVIYSGIAILFFWQLHGVSQIMSAHPLSMTDVAGLIVLFMPSICLLGLIFISFCKRAWIKNIAISVFVVQILTSPFFILLITQVNNKRATIIWSVLLVGSSTLFWILFLATLKSRKMCGHFQK